MDARHSLASRGATVLFALALFSTQAQGARRFPERFFSSPVPNEDVKAVAVGDVNGDGKPDALTRNLDDGSFDLLLGNGDGSLRPQAHLSMEIGAFGVALTDMNGDGRADVVIASYTLNQVTMRAGQPDGSLGAVQVLVSPSHPTALVCGDLDGDGRNDLAVTSYTEKKFRAYLQQADGSFLLATAPATSVDPATIALGDFDSDGDLDAAVVGPQWLRTYLNPGNGALALTQTYVAGAGASQVAVGDFNGDGFPDLLVRQDGPAPFTLRLGAGNGTFGAETAAAVAGNAEFVGTGDLDHDGIDDLVIAGGTVYRGTPGGTFSLVGPTPGPQGRTIGAVADFDDDGNLDIVTVWDRGPGISLVRGRGNGTFGDVVTPTISLPEKPSEMGMGDLDGDGRWDLVVRSSSVPSSPFQVYLTAPDGTPSHAYDLPGRRLGGRLAMRDMNADGRDDLVTLLYNPGAILVYLAQPDGALLPQIEHATSTMIPSAYGLGLVDANATVDAVVGETGTLSRFVGTGSGDFSPFYSIDDAQDPQSVTLVDITGDGYVDALVAEANNLYLYRGNGSPHFEQGTVQLPYQTALSAVMDFDNDGFLDLVIWDDANTVYLLYSGDGLGNFIQTRVLLPGASARPGTFGDVDGDGRVDMIVTRPVLSTISILYGEEGGGFGNQEDYGLDLTPGPHVLRDVNGDGHPDLVVMCANSKEVFVLLQNAEAVSAKPRPSTDRIFLGAATPNPARGAVSFLVTVPEVATARAQVYDLRGHRVRELDLAGVATGGGRVSWDGKDGRGVRVAAGVYFVRVTSESELASTKFVLMN